jgi:hypothetical protein
MDSRGRFRLYHRWTIPGSIFLLAFLPRAINPISWPMQWYERAIRFGDAVLAGDWAGTFQRYHPGVTTMWLSGIGLKVFASLRGLSPDQLLGTEPTQPGVIAEAVVAGVMPLALVIALCIALCYVLLRRLMDSRVPFVAACLLALDPFYIAQSQVLHVDALLATFMLVSALFLLNYLHRRRAVDLALSGLFGGLALLSKSQALFLIPYAGLAAGAHRMLGHGPGKGLIPYAGLAAGAHRMLGHGPGKERGAKWHRSAGWLWGVGRTAVVWVCVAAVAFVALWPAMWVQPLEVLDRMAQRIVFHVETPHRNPLFFNGRVTFEDAGPLFYLAVIGWKTTAVTLPMMCVGVLLATRQPRQGKRNAAMWLGLLAAYAVFFVAQMSLAARKELAYLLPAFPALDVLAAFGVVWTAEAVARVRQWQRLRWLPSAVIGAALAVQAGLVLPRHPYYGTLHNRLLGGSRVAQRILPLQDQGEGLDLAGRYLSTLPHAQRASAGLHQRGAAIFRRNFVGLTTAIDDPQADYRVYFVNQVMRQLDAETWEPSWEVDRRTDPLWTAAFGGVTYVWVYGAPPGELAAGGPEWEVDYRLGDHIRLERVRLSADTLSPGETLTVVLYWTSDGQVGENYKVFCHVVAEGEELAAQQDGFPVAGVRPTPGWRADEVIEDGHEIALGADLRPGKYALSVGMYDADSMARAPAYGADGERVPDDRIPLGWVTIEAAPGP